MSERIGLLVVGGGPAGFSAARAYRDIDSHGSIAIVTDEQLMPYERPPLTKGFLRGEVDRAELSLVDEGWLDGNHVALIGGRAVAMDADARTVTLSGGRTVGYESCLLATGAEPSRLPIPGADHPNVRVIRSLDDVVALLDRVTGGSRVAVIGSGFIGCEIAGSFRMRGNPVSLVSDESAPNVARLGVSAAALIESWLRELDVELQLGSRVVRLDHSHGVSTVVCEDERRIAADIVVMASGVRPRAELAEQAGITLDGGAIPVDAAMRTAREGVFAAGDVCQAENLGAGRALRVEHWGDALAQGEIAGQTAAGRTDVMWDAVPGFWSTVGEHTLKYAAWGDGYNESAVEQRSDGLVVWYGAAGRLVGVLAHDADDAYQRGRAEIRAGARWNSSVVGGR
jgi:NADPH-dependent 2,4-dienoyl-CoA reductase/sulfur reductase-like enzyme